MTKGTIAINKVKMNARLEHEYIQNYKMLQNTFKKVNIEKVELYKHVDKINTTQFL